MSKPAHPENQALENKGALIDRHQHNYRLSGWERGQRGERLKQF
jgi:hypothetical protein